VFVSRLLLLALVLFVVSAGAASARVDDHGGHGGGDDEVLVAGNCGHGVVSSLRLESHDRGIEVRVRLRQTSGRGVWRITIVHEDRVSLRAQRKTTRSEGAIELRRTFPDLPGSDTFAVHAWGPGGLGCRATATIQ
jgi:hypothetical protein